GPDDNAAGRAFGPARSWTASRHGSQRAGDWPGVAAVGGTQGQHNAEPAAAWGQHRSASTAAGPAAAPIRQTLAGSGRAAAAAHGRSAQDGRSGGQSALVGATRTTAASLRQAIAWNGRAALAASGRRCWSGRSASWSAK